MDVAAQVKAARSAAGLSDRSARGKILVRGNDRLTFLHNMLSNSITTLTPGTGCRAELLDDHGHVTGDLRLFAEADRLLIDTEPGRAEAIRAALDKYVIMDDVQLEDASEALALFTVSGPKAADVISSALGTEAPGADYRSIRRADALIARTRFTGVDFDVWTAAETRDAIHSALAGAVTAAGGAEISADAFEVMRIEAGVARQGADLEGVIALEARLDKDGTISFSKGCYLGQEVMARIDSRGHVNRLLVGMLVESADAPAPGTIVRADGKEIGKITSSALSPTLSKTIALGYVRREHSEPGASLVVGEAKATVAALPFVT